jgi:hypothetical protein
MEVVPEADMGSWPNVALAELIGTTSLLTTDARLAGATGLRCRVRVL